MMHWQEPQALKGNHWWHGRAGWRQLQAIGLSTVLCLVPTVVNALDTPVMISVVTFWHFSPYSHCVAVQSLTLLVELLPSPTPSLLSSGPRTVTLISFPTGVRGLSSGGHCTSPDSFTPRSSFFWQGVLPPPDLSPLWIHVGPHPEAQLSEKSSKDWAKYQVLGRTTRDTPIPPSIAHSKLTFLNVWGQSHRAQVK